jgi:hypothetical protein
MDNEDQVASILCHEIAHNILEHSLKMILDGIQENRNDKETFFKMKNLSVNRSKMAFEFLKQRVYRKSEEKRQHEIEADSLGYLLFKNSKYKKEAFLNALINLKNFDSISPRIIKKETYINLYDLPEQPFKERWMKKEDFSLYNYDHFKEKLQKDSISSHPEAIKRIETLKNYFPELETEVAHLKGEKDFLDLQFMARREILPNFYHSEDFGLGIYVAMQFLQDGESKEYHEQWLGKMFQKIYEGRKNYNLNRYLDRVNPKDQSESYQQFLNFMWNLDLDEIKIIADHYQKENP